MEIKIYIKVQGFQRLFLKEVQVKYENDWNIKHVSGIWLLNINTQNIYAYLL